jgi:Uma2 family endonuclease
MNHASHQFPQRHHVTVTEWHKMGEYNVFEPETRIELVEGEIIDMAPIGPSHGGCVKTLINLFSKQITDKAILSVQDPIQLSDFSEPEPDIALLRVVSHFYRKRHPTATDVLLVVEVAETSAKHDRNKKIPLYARHGIVECWLIDLTANQVEIYLSPSTDGYAEKHIARSGQNLVPSQLPRIKIAVSDILS